MTRKRYTKLCRAGFIRLHMDCNPSYLGKFLGCKNLDYKKAIKIHGSYYNAYQSLREVLPQYFV